MKDVLLTMKNTKFGKLNNGVYFTFLKDLQGGDKIFFDVKSWGRILEERIRKKREEGGNISRLFNFAVLKSSLHDFNAFGDNIEKSRIQLDDEMLNKITSDDIQFSTLVEISNILKRTEKMSIEEIINKNIQFLNGIIDEENAENISKKLRERRDKETWTIFDFVDKNVTIKELTEMGVNEENAKNILKDAQELTKVFREN